VQRFRGGLVCKAHRLLYHSTLGLTVIKKKDLDDAVLDNQLNHRLEVPPFFVERGAWSRVYGLDLVAGWQGLGVWGKSL